MGDEKIIGKSEQGVVADDRLSGGIEQVREILFGAFYRDLEQRFARSEGRAAARLQDLNEESRRRAELLETHLKRETDALAARVDRQHGEITDGARALGREQREAVAAYERRIAKLEEAQSRGLEDLRHQLLEQAKDFLDHLQELKRDVLATLQRELGTDAGELPGDRSEVEGGAPH